MSSKPFLVQRFWIAVWTYAIDFFGGAIATDFPHQILSANQGGVTLNFDLQVLHMMF
jgi:hypothetical protein